MDVKKVEKIKSLRDQRKQIDEDIRQLVKEVEAEFAAEIRGGKKRKSRAPKQLSLVK